MSVNVAVVYYSSTGNVHQLARAVAEGAADAGADARLRRVAELAPEAAIDADPRWRAHLDTVAIDVPEVTHDDLGWADAYAFGTPTRFGGPSAELKHFIDSTVELWRGGTFAGKPVTSFTSAFNRHGGQESTLLAMNNVFYHWGSVLVPPGYTDPLLYAAGGNPYGTSHVLAPNGEPPTREILDAARYQGRRLVEVATRLVVREAAAAH